MQLKIFFIKMYHITIKISIKACGYLFKGFKIQHKISIFNFDFSEQIVSYICNSLAFKKKYIQIITNN